MQTIPFTIVLFVVAMKGPSFYYHRIAYTWRFFNTFISRVLNHIMTFICYRSLFALMSTKSNQIKKTEKKNYVSGSKRRRQVKMCDYGRNQAQLSKRCVFSRVHATLQPALSVGRSVGWLVTLYFFYHFYFFKSFFVILNNFKAFLVILSQSKSF